MIEITAIPSTSEEQDTLTRYLSGKRSKSRPSIHAFLEENKKQSHSGKNEWVFGPFVTVANNVYGKKKYFQGHIK